MKPYLLSTCLLLLSLSTLAQSPSEASSRKVGFFFAPGVSTFFLPDHLGLAVNFQGGLTLFDDHLAIGLLYTARSGPINPFTIAHDLPPGLSYRGQSTLHLRADHGYVGLMIAPAFTLGPQDRLRLEMPLSFGTFGAGFYLVGPDRETPDGRRVSEWENELLAGPDGSDAAIVTGLDAGLQGWYRLGGPQSPSLGLGLHYMHAFGWDVTVRPSDYYNRLRASLSIRFGG